GVNLPDRHLVKFALTQFYGIGHHTAARICARFQMHDACKVRDLTPLQVTALAAELKQEIRENIAHQKMIGSYVGRRHAMALPVRGQTTQNNARTAKKLNRVERYR
ncbi:hypothetical protein C8R46DRAFT_894617, partial [Mycena filopes]